MKKNLVKNKEKSNFPIKVIILIIIALVLLLAVFFIIHSFTKTKYEQNVAMVNSQLSYCQELVVGEYRYSDVISLKKTAGFSKSYSIVKYSGIIRAGIKDLQNISYDISQNGRQILLRLPPAEILGNEIISQEIFDEKQSIFVHITTQEIFDEICNAKTQIEQNLRDSGLLSESWNHAATILEQFMHNIGFETVIIKIK